ncbi:PVC-type heme-binding CxxCH protein [Schlesneria sp. DSM 10557]|uniref:PVC-type heme-binding CxxCH protein n=1 Tax=Schlesneria sp. DSM 10557 TaxID=3044399 RepID=UPI0035C7E8AC
MVKSMAVFRMGQMSQIGLMAFVLLGKIAAAGEFTINEHVFTLPDGFEIEAVATSPLVDRPITADFDEQGRLYVADSSGSNERPDQQLLNPTHRIVRLADTDGDGRFDESVVFADKMMFPEGTMWYDGSLYVSAPPSIWKLTDTDGDGVADQRTEWFEGKTLTGCANDLHGPYLGPDGWIYWCKGAFAEQTYAQPAKPHAAASQDSPQPQLVTKAAHIFRRRADGTGFIENVMTGGMDNPVDVVFLPSGDRIFTTTFLQRPGGGLRDGLIHAIYGGVYGKVHDVTDFHPRTGDLMPPLVHMGPAAPSGLARYESTVFGEEFRDNLFAAQFNMRKVSRHALERVGATFKSTDSDFVVSSNLDFHPTDVIEDADGSLIICDTGGWYTLCCPTSQLTKPDILGGIYRVRRAGSPRQADARGLKLNWATTGDVELTARLGDARPAVARRSIQQLAKRGPAAVGVLKKSLQSKNDRTRLSSVWTLTRIDDPSARTAVQTAVSDPNLDVRLAALHSISLWKDTSASATLKKSLTDKSHAIRRAAAEAIGRIGDDTAAADLLGAVTGSEIDRELQHSVTYALIEIGKPVNLSVVPKERVSPLMQSIAMIANDQMPGGHVEPKSVIPWLTSNEPNLRETAHWLVGRHSEWGDSLAEYLQQRIAERNLTDDQRRELVEQLAQFAGNGAIQQLLADQIRPGESNPLEARRVALDAMRSSGLKELPASWLEGLTLTVAEGNPVLVPAAIGALRAIPVKSAHEPLTLALLEVASQTSFPDGVRVEALAAIPEGLSQPKTEHLQLLANNLGELVSVSTRSAAVDALVRSKLDADPLSLLAESIPEVGPLELNRLLGAFEHCSDEAVGLKLVDSLKNSPVLTSLRVDTVKARLAKFPSSVQTRAEELYAAINVEAGRQQEKLNELAQSLTGGDIRRGQLVFNSEKAACSACHAMGYKGGDIGPDLSRIGKIRTERDLLEAIVFPSVSFVRSYEPVLIVTLDGKQFNGLIRAETPEEITLATGAREKVRILKSDVEEIRPSTMSIMPAGLETQLTRQQLADLIAFLKAKQ